jgi:dTDP-4-dehydrorhamnose reductase/UDP-glucose 4-epimerase
LILVVGKNSFLAKEFIGKAKEIPLRAISHTEIDNREVFQGITCIVNFSFSPLLYLQDYDRELDVDARLAHIASDEGIHYVMLSTRKVYQETIQWGAREDAHVTGSSIYGKNKLRIEKNLANVLGGAVTILRPGNVFGYERQSERVRFGAYLLNQLADTGVIRLTVSPFVRRDVIPVDYFCEVLREVVLRKPGGVINIGAGESLEIGRIALWIIEGFGSGRLIVESPAECDEFQLDTERLKSEFGLNCGRERVADFSRELGRRLRRDMKRDVD